MQFNTLLVALFAAAVSAAPAESLDKRACKYVAATPDVGVSVNKQTPQGVSFYIPSGAGGPCQLEAYFPAGYPITSSGNAQVNVIDVDGPVAGSIVGTITFQSDPAVASTRVINSFGCRSVMSYRLEIAGAGPASVSYPAGAGLRISHSC